MRHQPMTASAVSTCATGARCARIAAIAVVLAGVALASGAIAADAASAASHGRIVFASNRDGGNQEIYSAAADGTDRVNLTRNPAFDQQPSLSPDGRRIV